MAQLGTMLKINMIFFRYSSIYGTHRFKQLAWSVSEAHPKISKMHKQIYGVKKNGRDPPPLGCGKRTDFWILKHPNISRLTSFGCWSSHISQIDWMKNIIAQCNSCSTKTVTCISSEAPEGRGNGKSVCISKSFLGSNGVLRWLRPLILRNFYKHKNKYKYKHRYKQK